QREKGLEDSPAACAFTHTFRGKRGLEAVCALTGPFRTRDRRCRARSAPSSAQLGANLSLFPTEGGLMKPSPNGHLAGAAANSVRPTQFEPDRQPAQGESPHVQQKTACRAQTFQENRQDSGRAPA